MSALARRALICGISGQDGSYLAKVLLDRGYEVWGSSRDLNVNRFRNLHRLGIVESVKLIPLNTSSNESAVEVLQHIKPDAVFHLSGQSSVKLSFEQPVETLDSIAMATLRLLESIRRSGLDIRFFSAGSTECFGDTGDYVADEESAFRPGNPYAISKATAFWTVAHYRRAYGMHACTGILANHESPLRPQHFVTSKIIHAVACLALGKKVELSLGNLAIERDWGWAPEFVEAMALMLDQPVADDYIVATGTSHTLTEFLAKAFELVGRDWREHTTLNEQMMRLTDVTRVRVGISKINRHIGWKARIHMPEVIGRLLEAELERLQKC